MFKPPVRCKCACVRDSQHAPRQLDTTLPRPPAQTTGIIPAPLPDPPTQPTRMPLKRRGMFPKHEHGFPALAIELFEQNKRLLPQAETALLVAVDDVEGVVFPVGVDVVFFEGGGEDFFAGVFHADAEGFEDFDAGGVRAGARGWGVVGWCGLGLRLLCGLVGVAAGIALVVWGWGGVGAVALRGEGRG